MHEVEQWIEDANDDWWNALDEDSADELRDSLTTRFRALLG
jgi:hypothetical protein